MKAKTKDKAPFLLSPYSKFDGSGLILIFGFGFLYSLYCFVLQKEDMSLWLVIMEGAMFLIFFYMFRIMYKSILLEEDHIVVLNWLGRDKTYLLSEIKGYKLRETWDKRGQITTMIILTTISDKKIIIDRKYYYEEKLRRLIAAFDRYQIPYLGFEEMKIKNKYQFARVSLYIYYIAGFLISLFMFLRHLKN